MFPQCTLVAERAERAPSPPNSEHPRAPETCPRKRCSLSGMLLAERVPSLVQSDTAPSKVQELTRRRRLASLAGGARSPTSTSILKSARYSPASHGRPVRDGEQGASQELAVRIFTLQITLAHLRRWWRQRFRKGRSGLGAPMSTGALPVPARHERSRARRCTSRHRACPPLQRRQSGQARNLRALGRGRCAQSRVAPPSAHFSTRASLKNAPPKGRGLPTRKGRERLSQSRRAMPIGASEVSPVASREL
jgi:hypothetical protein